MFFNSSLEQRCDDNSRDLSFARFFDKSQSFTNDLPVTVVFEWLVESRRSNKVFGA